MSSSLAMLSPRRIVGRRGGGAWMHGTITIATGALAIILVGCGGTAGAPNASMAAVSGPSSSPIPTASAEPTAAPSVATQAIKDVPVVPTSPLPDPSGDALPSDLVGRTYGVNPPETLDDRELMLTLRAADDPHCMAMYDGRSTCFTVLWSPAKTGDPGARGSATIVDGKLVLGFALVPFDKSCVGASATYAYEDAGQTLRGITPACGFPGFRQLDSSVSQ